MDSKSDDEEESKIDYKLNYNEEKVSRISNSELIDKVQNYFYTDKDLLCTFESFAAKNCHYINLDSDEYNLKYTELYNEYRALFEENIEGYISSLGVTVLEFFNALKEATEEDADSNDAVFGQILFAISDFDVFMVMMKEAAQSQAMSNNHK